MELQVHDLHKSFDGREVLHGISFSISSGKALGLLGRNGAGKSTTIRILMDVFKADQGRAWTVSEEKGIRAADLSGNTARHVARGGKGQSEEVAEAPWYRGI